jgi:hypothetical protein
MTRIPLASIKENFQPEDIAGQLLPLQERLNATINTIGKKKIKPSQGWIVY